METLAVIEPTLAAVRQYLKAGKVYGYVSSSPVKVKLYADSPDPRIGWDKTYIVLVNDLPYAYTDEPLQEPT